jgi:hypothetical protein
MELLNIKIMKKLLMTLAVCGSTYGGAEAQALQNIIYGLTHFNSALEEGPVTKINACGVSSGKVCRIGKDRKVQCYSTAYNENFNVCKGNSGYYICCETPGYGNVTHPKFVVVAPAGDNTYTPPPVIYYNMGRGNTGGGTEAMAYAESGNNDARQVVPESQSYTSAAELKRERSYLANDIQTHGIRVCYTGENVAENSLNPYRGCPSPQYDGPEKNERRNEILPTPDNPDFNAQLLK